MSALPADIARYTNDGVVVRSPTTPSVTASILAIAPDAQDTGSDPIETFWVNASDAQVMNDERFYYQSQLGPLHLKIELQDEVGIGTDIPLVPNVPCFRVLDVATDLDQIARTAIVALNLETDRYAVEVIQ